MKSLHTFPFVLALLSLVSPPWPLSDWDFRWKFIEGGDQMTKGGSFRLVGTTDDGVLTIPWSTEKGDSGHYTLDIETLEPVTTVATIEPAFPGAVHQ